MPKVHFQKFGSIILLLTLLFSPIALANDEENVENVGGADPGSPNQAMFKGRCELAGVENSIYADFPECASSPNECFSNDEGKHPLNCFYLIEPIGGKPNFDLFKRVRVEQPAGSSDSGVGNQDLEDEITAPDDEDPEAPSADEASQGDQTQAGKVTYQYQPWSGESLIPGLEEGPYQAILVYEPGKDYQGPFGLLYSYVGLAYNYISGFILGVVILIVIIGGIEMITSAGNSEQFGKGRSHITKALIGMVIWFLASVILYTINPTFFRF